jgi:ferritin-like metal-binding protein YciE
MEPINDLRNLLKHELQDLYSAEVQLIKALPDMEKKATNPKLKKAFSDHLEVTKEHRNRLNKVQQMLSDEKATPENKGFFAKLFSSEEGDTHCKAMEGLIKEGKSLMSDNMTPEVMDAALIAAAQKVEHYEISSYGTARAYAIQLGLNSVTSLLKETLDEEYEADDSLTELALGTVNLKAEKAPASIGKPVKEKSVNTDPAAKKAGAAKSIPAANKPVTTKAGVTKSKTAQSNTAKAGDKKNSVTAPNKRDAEPIVKKVMTQNASVKKTASKKSQAKAASAKKNVKATSK